MRIAIATLLGGLVMFIWGMLAHMLLPIGSMSMRAPLDEGKILTALHDNLPNEHAVYLLPFYDPNTEHNDKTNEAYSARARSNPYAFIVYSPIGKDPMATFPYNLFHQWLSDTLAALIVALIMIRAGVGVSRGLLIGLGFGIFTWLSLSVPYWNWYRFPGPFTLGYLLEQAFGWLLAGAAMGWWLGRKRPD
ncbi:hypothetical protein SAMN02800694_2752 [Luteibacter sp. UNCMF331Sha3.1]|uniref:hypothetical protein n=1 Tax=Luteibacter sp. UNCMF331Sha3.1 TaxID=1502760 RepID=UPI0004924D36|nr:hypothetical protein [Luteibacter sp. UNCMF331Sha3.1]SEN09481.1 hypothetical protein SAMN02800694_2752 [Luteibacter sp. UNCMF331Sha3.1]